MAWLLENAQYKLKTNSLFFLSVINPNVHALRLTLIALYKLPWKSQHVSDEKKIRGYIPQYMLQRHLLDFTDIASN